MPTFQLRTTTPALVLVTASLLVACGREESRENSGTTAASAEAAHAMSRTAQDMAITTGVKTRLAGDSQLSALDIHVETSEGRVLLRGIAPDTGVRRHAAELARNVTGVVAVTNDLSVQVLSR